MRCSSNVRYAILCNICLACLVHLSTGEEKIVKKHTTNNNLNNVVVLSLQSCLNEGYYAAYNVNDCRVLLDKALQDNKISSSSGKFEQTQIDTLLTLDYPFGCVVNFDKEKILTPIQNVIETKLHLHLLHLWLNLHGKA